MSIAAITTDPSQRVAFTNHEVVENMPLALHIACTTKSWEGLTDSELRDMHQCLAAFFDMLDGSMSQSVHTLRNHLEDYASSSALVGGWDSPKAITADGSVKARLHFKFNAFEVLLLLDWMTNECEVLDGWDSYEHAHFNRAVDNVIIAESIMKDQTAPLSVKWDGAPLVLTKEQRDRLVQSAGAADPAYQSQGNFYEDVKAKAKKSYESLKSKIIKSKAAPASKSSKSSKSPSSAASTDRIAPSSPKPATTVHVQPGDAQPVHVYIHLDGGGAPSSKSFDTTGVKHTSGSGAAAPRPIKAEKSATKPATRIKSEDDKKTELPSSSYFSELPSLTLSDEYRSSGFREGSRGGVRFGVRDPFFARGPWRRPVPLYPYGLALPYYAPEPPLVGINIPAPLPVVAAAGAQPAAYLQTGATIEDVTDGESKQATAATASQKPAESYSTAHAYNYYSPEGLVQKLSHNIATTRSSRDLEPSEFGGIEAFVNGYSALFFESIVGADTTELDAKYAEFMNAIPDAALQKYITALVLQCAQLRNSGTRRPLKHGRAIALEDMAHRTGAVYEAKRKEGAMPHPRGYRMMLRDTDKFARIEKEIKTGVPDVNLDALFKEAYNKASRLGIAKLNDRDLILLYAVACFSDEHRMRNAAKSIFKDKFAEINMEPGFREEIIAAAIRRFLGHSESVEAHLGGMLEGDVRGTPAWEMVKRAYPTGDFGRDVNFYSMDANTIDSAYPGWKTMGDAEVKRVVDSMVQDIIPGKEMSNRVVMRSGDVAERSHIPFMTVVLDNDMEALALVHTSSRTGEGGVTRHHVCNVIPIVGLISSAFTAQEDAGRAPYRSTGALFDNSDDLGEADKGDHDYIYTPKVMEQTKSGLNGLPMYARYNIRYHLNK
jgi:hypothetical protein